MLLAVLDVLTVLRRRQLTGEHGEAFEDGSVLLSADGRKLVASQVLERLNDELTYRRTRHRWKEVLVLEARHLSGYLLGRADAFNPYIHRWK